MKRTKRAFGSLRREGSRDLTIHVNMAPMIDFLVITIAFVLMSVSFVSVGTISSMVASDPQAGGMAGDRAPEKKTLLEVVILSNHEIASRIVESTDGKIDTFSTEMKLEDLKRYSIERPFSSVILNAEKGIPYGEVIELLGQLRSISPQVSLSTDFR